MSDIYRVVNHQMKENTQLSTSNTSQHYVTKQSPSVDNVSE